MHGASRLALPRLPRTCFLPLAKLGSAVAVVEPSAKTLGFRVPGLGFRV